MKTTQWYKFLFGLVAICVLVVLFGGYLVEEEASQNTSNFKNIYSINPTATFEPVLPNTKVSLPQDFAFHPEFQNETWAYFGNLFDYSGNEYSVQWTYQRVSRDERDSNGWKNPQLYIAQIVIASKDKVWRQQRVARGGIGQAGMLSRPFRLWIDNWNWRSISLSPVPGLLNVSADSFKVLLNSFASSSYLAEGEGGYRQEHNFLPTASYSFQMPLINVAGELILDGTRIGVTGKAVLRKSWDSDIAIVQTQKQVEINLHLDNGKSLYLKQNDIDGLPKYTSGMLANIDGTKHNLTDGDIVMMPSKFVLLANGKLLPLQWTLRVPKYDINVTVQATNHEMWHPFIVPYWQGKVFSSESKTSGYLKLSGY